MLCKVRTRRNWDDDRPRAYYVVCEGVEDAARIWRSQIRGCDMSRYMVSVECIDETMDVYDSHGRIVDHMKPRTDTRRDIAEGIEIV